MLYFHTLKNTLSSDTPRHISLDIIPDIVAINTIALRAHCTGVIILGGGLIKHHICNANLMRNGADFAVYINTSGEFDGSDAGASPEEAISWGKIRAGAQSVKVYSLGFRVNGVGVLRCHDCVPVDCREHVCGPYKIDYKDLRIEDIHALCAKPEKSTTDYHRKC